MSEGEPRRDCKPRPLAQKIRVSCKTGTRGDDTDSPGFPDSFVTNLLEELRVGESQAKIESRGKNTDNTSKKRKGSRRKGVRSTSRRSNNTVRHPSSSQSSTKRTASPAIAPKSAYCPHKVRRLCSMKITTHARQCERATAKRCA